ncbi:MAG: hypothetical protein ACI9TH_005105 [Kiritimatiellia bacterium]|jgi:hypothetical protein
MTKENQSHQGVSVLELKAHQHGELFDLMLAVDQVRLIDQDCHMFTFGLQQ